MSRALNKDDDIKGAPSLEKMLGDLFRMKANHIDKPAQMRAAAILRRYGFRRRQIRKGLGKVFVWYPDWLEDDGLDDVPEVEVVRTVGRPAGGKGGK